MSLGGSCVLSLNYRSERTFHPNDVQINVVVLCLGYVQVDVLFFFVFLSLEWPISTKESGLQFCNPSTKDIPS